MRSFAMILALLWSGSAAFADDIEDLEAQLHEIAALTVSGLPVAESMTKYVDYFSEDSVLLPAGGDPIEGKAAILEFYVTGFEGVEILTNEYSEIVSIVDGDFAVRRYIGTASARSAPASDPSYHTNRYVDVLRNDDGEWKIVWHSFVPVPASTN
jgi:ketosteroid isomerase-like protein